MIRGRGTALCALLLVLSSAGLACADSGGSADLATAQGDDKRIPRLASGLSVQEVERQLGQPQSQVELEGGEVSLQYGLWQLVFDPNLITRIRSYRAGFWPKHRPFGPLDRDVRELSSGSSRATVESKVGKTEAWEVLSYHENERLWYGNGRWKLVLSDQALTKKVLFRGGSPQSVG